MIDALAAFAWRALEIVWGLVLIAAIPAIILWALTYGRRVNTDALERGKVETQARSETQTPLDRGMPNG